MTETRKSRIVEHLSDSSSKQNIQVVGKKEIPLDTVPIDSVEPITPINSFESDVMGITPHDSSSSDSQI